MSRRDQPLRAFLGAGPSPGQLRQEFQDIKVQAIAFRQQQGFSTEAGARKENIKKNRYKDILPYDQTRVILNLRTDEGQTDYINASFIEGLYRKRCYIATQGPLAHTLLDFWCMIWEYEVKVVAMACREVEMGKKKCERYWPLEQEPLQIGPFSILQLKEQELNPDVIVRTLRVSFQQEERPLTHLQYVAWPDRGIPDNYGHFLEMIEHMRLKQGEDSAPICVHCSAGCGRTGVICTLEHVRHLLLQQSVPPDFSIFNIVLAMRKQRPSAVQTLAVAELFRAALAPGAYENLTENRLPLYDDAVSLRGPAPFSKRSGVLRSISVPAEPTPELPPKMNDTYAVVNKHRRGGGPARETRPGQGSPEGSPLDFQGLQASYSLPGSPVKQLPPTPSCEYSHISSSGTGDASPRGPPSPCPSTGRGKAPLYSLKPPGLMASPQKKAPSSPRHEYTDSYEDLGSSSCGGYSPITSPTSGLGYNFRIRKPKGPRDPPAEWTRL
ncbi:tyrosine-protein phosphatase non-receptor type 18 isoform X2 [Carettochelys insculpta]|uniref:tyrosine-protein phosphatase non-receptor type 18 isoform X2 n=1 Tax=Carettochelys insculpta TaxID=44489 RepID=UPI003EBB9E63